MTPSRWPWKGEGLITSANLTQALSTMRSVVSHCRLRKIVLKSTEAALEGSADPRQKQLPVGVSEIARACLTTWCRVPMTRYWEPVAR